ncbi:hypothetical protein F5Y12DRAFT_596902 [Xylaria sp. FL1777]|nr:hypothetical protein F5Y12DRAFT_596902 [Xylaria sp. FL1777]
MAVGFISNRSSFNNFNNNNNSEVNNVDGDSNSIGDTTTAISSSSANATLNNATRTIYTASIITLVFLAVQAIACSALLIIWLRRRRQARPRERQKMEQRAGLAGYVRPIGYWGLPSSVQQQQQQHGPSPWQDVQGSTSPVQFAGPASAPAMTARCDNGGARSEFALVVGERREMSA